MRVRTTKIGSKQQRNSEAARVDRVDVNGADGARRGAVNDFEARWAHMDDLARQLGAVWPKEVSAVDAIEDVRR